MRARAWPLGPPPVAQLPPDDGEQPVAEGALRRVVLQPAHRADDGAEDVLGEVAGVGFLQALLPRVAVHQGRVQLDELAPGLRIVGVAEAQEQAGTGTGDQGLGPRNACRLPVRGNERKLPREGGNTLKKSPAGFSERLCNAPPFRDSSGLSGSVLPR